jgi:hypothetical protein
MNLKKNILPLCLGMLLVLSACNLTDSLNTTEQPAPQISGEPVVQIASPLPNEIYMAGASINILGRVENAGEDIASIEILVDGESIGSAQQPNQRGALAFTITNSWVANGSGTRTITLRAVRADETIGESSVNVDVFVPEDQMVQVDPQPTETFTLPTPVTVATELPAPTQEQVVQQQQTEPTQAQTEPTQAQPAATNTQAVPPTSTVPQIRVLRGANLRSGPGVVFNPPVGSLPENATANILAVSPDRQWYRIQTGVGGGTSWITASVVETTGDLANLPIESGPPTPVPTAVPATAVPATVAATTAPSNTDLSITLVTSNPDPLVCNQAATISVTIVNTGATASTDTTVIVENVFGGAVSTSATAAVGPLGQNQSVTISLVLTVSTNIAVNQTIRARIDPDNRVGETNEGNNQNEKGYTLQAGTC